MSEKLKIKLSIGGKVFPLTIEREKEERYRRAEREVNEWCAKFESRYTGDKIDHLAMTALQLAVIRIEDEMNKNLESEREKLEKLDRELDKHLNTLG